MVPFDPTDTAGVSNFAAAYGLTAPLPDMEGPFVPALPAGTGRVALERPVAPDVAGEGVAWSIVDEVFYATVAPWPDGGPDGTWTRLPWATIIRC